VEIARKETTAPKCKGGNCEKRKLWHSIAGGGKYGTSLYGQPKELLVRLYIKTNKNLRFSRNM